MDSARTGWRIALVSSLFVASVLATSAASQTPPAQVPPPVPKPFPQPGQPGQTGAPASPVPQTPAQPATPPPAQSASQSAASPVDATIGAPIFTGAELLSSIDAGQGQRFYLYGTNAPYADVVSFYKQALKTGGRELFKAPAMQQFDLGKFQEETMAFVPSVVVKDYTWNGSAGYLQVTGTTEKRFATVIQIVPAPAR
jgi:hypothetical protein